MKGTNVARVVLLAEMRKQMQDKLERLKKMEGWYQEIKGGPHYPKCHRVTFESGMSASCGLHSGDDPELNVKLVRTAIGHMESRLAEIDETLALVEENISGVKFKG
jgi:hypothetical protein